MDAKRQYKEQRRAAKSTPFSNCRYPTGVSVAGVDTVSRPGLASGTDDVPDCARPSGARQLKMKNKQIGTIFNLFPQKRQRKSISETNAARTSACMLPFPVAARPTRARERFASTPCIW